MIDVIDYGVGNLGSVLNMVKKIGGQARIVSTPEEVLSSKKLILPGVGSFDAGMSALTKSGLAEALVNVANQKTTIIFGICLGMQLLLEESEEGNLSGLGIVPGRVKKFRASQNDIRVPHMGWNIVKPVKDSLLFDEDEGKELRFYFVHSYYVECKEQEDIVSKTHYGHDFVSTFQRGNVIGAQFHPEKSHRFGMALIKRFSEIPC